MVVHGLFFKRWIIAILCYQTLVSGLDAGQSSLYLLPEQHPIKPILDIIFTSSRVLLNLDNLEKAGFSFSKPRTFTNLIIARHPAIPGYIFKLYLDAQRFHKDKSEKHFWRLRIQGSLKVRQQIERANLHHLIKVPQKWIYKIPKKPTLIEGYMPKTSILVEEDMDLLSKEDNEAIWASPFVTNEHLDAVYLILSQVGLSDCAKPDNIPFSRDGRIAFIDTQTSGESVPYKNLSTWLSEANKNYWIQISQ